MKKKITTYQEGVTIRRKEIEKAKLAIAKDEKELLKLKNEEKILKPLVDKLKGTFSLNFFNSLRHFEWTKYACQNQNVIFLIGNIFLRECLIMLYYNTESSSVNVSVSLVGMFKQQAVT